MPPFLQTRNGKGEAVPATNEAGFGYGVNVGTSPPNLIAAQVHAGAGLQEEGPGEPWGWNGTGAITPIQRYADMLSGTGLAGTDGSEWYFPERLTIDTGAVGDGNANPAQEVLDVHSTMGSNLPTSLKMLAIGAELGKAGVLKATEILAEQSGIPPENLTLINEEKNIRPQRPGRWFSEQRTVQPTRALPRRALANRDGPRVLIRRRPTQAAGAGPFLTGRLGGRLGR